MSLTFGRMSSAARIRCTSQRRRTIGRSAVEVRRTSFHAKSAQLMVSIVGIYANSGLSGYQVATESLPNNDTVVYGDQGPNFPVQWAPRYAYAVSSCTSSCPLHATDLERRLALLLILTSAFLKNSYPARFG